MPLRRAAQLALTAPAVAALTATLLVPMAAAGAPTQASLGYSCLPAKSDLVTDPHRFDMPVDATLEARSTGSTVALTMSTGRPVLPGIDSQITVRMSSTMVTEVDGTATTLRGSRDVTITPGAPTDLPVLAGTATSSAATVAVAPGDLTMEFTYLLWTVRIACNPTAATTIQVPVAGRETTTPTPEPTPSGPLPMVKPTLKAGLTKKVQRVGKAPARVKVTLARPSAHESPVAGKVVVKVGKKRLDVRKVTDATRYRVVLPRTLRPGRHKVTVTFTPGVHTSAYATVTARAQVRVRR